MRFEAALVDQTEEQEEVFSSQEKSNDSTNTLSSVELTSQNELSLSEKHQDESVPSPVSNFQALQQKHNRLNQFLFQGRKRTEREQHLVRR